ncbi:MAG: hypothetical protein MAG451_00319 [Anaerolineales bacterium]|nr:hypothetical protein [Anaerolineales bacterium]
MNALKLASIVLCLTLLVGAGGATAVEEIQQAADGLCTNDSSAYDPDCDVNRNGEVKVDDITLVAMHWGTTGDPTVVTGDGWSLTGNAGTNPTSNFLGTTDDVAFDIRVDSERALRIEPASDLTFGFSPNLIGGYSSNAVGSGVLGAMIAGGGRSGALNQVMADFGTVSGGAANTASSFATTVAGGETNQASGFAAVVGGGSANRAGAKFSTVGGGIANEASGGHATVPGGLSNTAAGDYSFAAGRQAKIDSAHDGAFLFA